MKGNRQAISSAGGDTDFYRAFIRLGPEHRRRVALRILRDQRVLADLYDHFLIQEALGERGRRTSWRAYLRRRRTAAR